MNIGEAVRALRVSCGWSQEELADKSNTNRHAIYRWENGLNIPRFDMANHVLRAMGYELYIRPIAKEKRVNEK